MKNKAAVALGKLKKGVVEIKSEAKLKACLLSLKKARSMRWSKKIVDRKAVS